MDFNMSEKTIEACKKASIVIDLIDYIKKRYCIKLQLDKEFKSNVFNALAIKYGKHDDFVFFNSDGNMTNDFISLYYAYKLSCNGTRLDIMHKYLKIKKVI